MERRESKVMRTIVCVSAVVGMTAVEIVETIKHTKKRLKDKLKKHEPK